MNDITKCVQCGRPATVGVTEGGTMPYTHYCLEHEPEGYDALPVNNQVDDLDEVTHD
jgi:hypothetical protein